MSGFVSYPDPVLSQVATSRPVDEAMLTVGGLLLDAAREVQAYGLAASHIGQIEPLVVLSLAGQAVERDYRVLYKPEVTGTAQETAFGAEGSVSMPGIEVPVERPIWAEVAFDTSEGQRDTLRLEGLVARVALHEIDQMNGIFFLSRISRVKRDTAIRKFAKSLRR